MRGQARTVFADFSFRRHATLTAERRCHCCGEPMAGLVQCWNPACADSVHDAVTASWPPAGDIIVTTGAAVR